MLHENDIKEHLALSYVYAVATRAGIACEDVRADRDSIDINLKFRNDNAPTDAALYSPELRLQVKGHPLANIPSPTIPFFLKRKNHHDLVKRAMVPRLLVVVVLPQDPEKWLDLTEDQLVLRHCGYWINLLGQSPTTNDTGETVHLPRTQVFNPSALKRLMAQAAHQEQLQ